jgi:hypothetical protein
MYSIALLLCALSGLPLLTVCGAVVDDAPKGTRMVAWVLRCAPHAGDAELAAATLFIVVGTIDSSPSVATPQLYAPALLFGMPECFFDLFLRVRRTGHQ